MLEVTIFINRDNQIGVRFDLQALPWGVTPVIHVDCCEGKPIISRLLPVQHENVDLAVEYALAVISDQWDEELQMREWEDPRFAQIV